jgi:hypothetical protein
VEERLDEALRVTGLTRPELEPLVHYTDFVIVAATLPGSRWMLYWDPEARLAEPVDWVKPALELMHSDPRILVANPSWELPDSQGRRPGVERETIEISRRFAIGASFSDQVFLARRAELAAPIYDQRCLGRLLYPTAHKAHIAEARILAHMRHHGRLRATSLSATYVTVGEQGGSNYSPRGVTEAARYARNALFLRALRASPWRPRCVRNTWL